MSPLRRRPRPRRDLFPASPPPRNDLMMRFCFYRRLARRAATRAAMAALAFAVAGQAAGAQSAVQGVPNAMQGFSQNRDQPIQIEAASLEMRDKKKEATFAGN